MNRNLFVERIPSGVFFAGPSNRRPTRMDARELMLSPGMDSAGMGYANVSAGHAFPRFGTTSAFTTPKQFRQPSPHPPPLPPPYPSYPSPIPSRPLTPHEEPQPVLCLPLLNVVVDVQVDSTIAHTKLVQSFTNLSGDSIPEARYTFPLYDGSVVTSFRCTIGDVRVLDGQVKPKEKARQDFKKAVEKREAAALLEEHTPEVFETVIGNIPACTVVKIEITYVNELKAVMVDDSTEGLAVIIPMSIAPRYGDPPEGSQQSSELEDNGLEITIKVNDNGTINSLAPTSGHAFRVRNIKVQSDEVTSFADLAKGKQTDTARTLTQAVASYKSDRSILESDFVVTIEMQDTSPLRSRAVLSPVNETGHAALMVNIKPSDIFSNAVRAENFAGEIVFIIDRSASMGWPSTGTKRTKIETLRRAMPLSLTSLPMSCAFNIISFGSEISVMWETSKPYSQENLSTAKALVSNVQSDMGGTDILPAFQAAIDRRLEDRESLQVILITDGEAEPEDILQFVWKERQELQDRIRFFTLGIGDKVSHRLIESIGDFGGGCSEVVDINANPKWESRLTRMLKCAMMPNSWTCDINLGSAFERKDFMSYKFCEEPRPESSVVPYVQSTYPIPPLHPFAYGSIFFLLDLGAKSPPKEVTLKTTTAKTGEQIAILKVEPTWTDKSTIHHLATKHALVGLDAQIQRENPGRAEADLAVWNAENLGVLYSVTSKWTSFVAVDRDTKAADEIDVYKADLVKIDIDSVLESLQDEPEDIDYGGGFAFGGVMTGNLVGTAIQDVNLTSSSGVDRYYSDGDEDGGGSPLQSAGRIWPRPLSHVTPLAGAAIAVGAAGAAASAALIPHRQLLGLDRGASRSSSSLAVPPSYPEPKGPKPSSLKSPTYEPLGDRRRSSSWGDNDYGNNSHLRPQALSYSDDDDNDKDEDDEIKSNRADAGDDEIKSNHADADYEDDLFNDSPGTPGFEEVIDAAPREWTYSDTVDSEEIWQSVRHDSGDADEPADFIPWEAFVPSQQASGMFDLPDYLKKKLESHFCPRTSTILGELLQILKLAPTKEAGDTLMVIQYFKTHMANEQDLWGLMIDKAEYDMITRWQNDSYERLLESLRDMLESSIVHVHYLPTDKWPSNGAPGPFPSSKDRKSCKVCGCRAEEPTALVCPMKECGISISETSNWDELWKHQVESGHVVCRKSEDSKKGDDDNGLQAEL